MRTKDSDILQMCPNCGNWVDVFGERCPQCDFLVDEYPLDYNEIELNGTILDNLN